MTVVPMMPPGRPQWTAEQVRARLLDGAIADRDGPTLLGVRGYYRAMGAPGVNDRGIYDDAIFLLSSTAFVAFNANTDPSVRRPRVAVLRTGSWLYRLGTHGLSKPEHRRYPALVQAAVVTVDRDGAPAETGWFGINIHRGGRNSTSSEGCQTIWPDQWEAFIALVRTELARRKRTRIWYRLIETNG